MTSLITVFPIAVSHHIFLDLLGQEHAKELFSLIDSNRDYLKQWLGWLDVNLSSSDSAKFIDHATKQFEAAASVITGIFLEGQMVGIASIQEIDWPSKEFSLGYWIAAKYQGYGIITRSIAELIKVGFEQLKLQRAIIYAAVENHKSQAIPLRLGFAQVGVKKDYELLYGKHTDYFQFELFKPADKDAH
eukprot:gene183-244_t